jgi:hypothetical protein
MITKETVASRLSDYLNHRLTLPQLVNWSENAWMDGDLAPDEVELLADVLGRLGVADVRQFGLTWEDCEDILRRLGFDARVEVSPA